MVTLDDVRRNASPGRFPHDALIGCDTALVLFAAGFHGQQDAIWIADAGLRATCVDTDHGRLGEMVLAYPEGWEYVHGDVFEYATSTGRVWDVVSLDPPTNLFDRCAGMASLWCGLANHAVILGSGDTPELDLPNGWRIGERLKRSSFNGGVYWTVLERC